MQRGQRRKDLKSQEKLSEVALCVFAPFASLRETAFVNVRVRVSSSSTNCKAIPVHLIIVRTIATAEHAFRPPPALKADVIDQHNHRND